MLVNHQVYGHTRSAQAENIKIGGKPISNLNNRLQKQKILWNSFIPTEERYFKTCPSPCTNIGNQLLLLNQSST